MFQAGLFNFLQSSFASPLTVLIGTPLTRSDETTGIFAMLATNEATMPYLVFQRISGRPVTSLQGANKLHNALFRFSCYGSSYPSAADVAEQLKLLFATFTGTWSDGTEILDITCSNEADDTESIPHGTIYAVHLDFEFWYVDNS